MNSTYWSLWKGENRLADIYLRKPSKTDRLEGALFISPACRELSSIWQVRMEFPFGSRVFQHPKEPDIVAERGKRPVKQSSGPVALKEVSEAELEGVPPDQQFVVRDEAGTVRSARQISLLLSDAPDPEIATYPPGICVDGVVWLIWAAF
jgi:hypothetical protein